MGMLNVQTPDNFDELRRHVRHKVAIVTYGNEAVYNVAIECETCNEVLLDYNNPKFEIRSVEGLHRKEWK